MSCCLPLAEQLSQSETVKTRASSYSYVRLRLKTSLRNGHLHCKSVTVWLTVDTLKMVTERSVAMIFQLQWR